MTLLPSAARGFVLKRGKQGVPSLMTASHDAFFDWSYKADMPQMRDLYRRAKQGQWDGETALDWTTDVDPLNPEVPILPYEFFQTHRLAEFGIDGSKNMVRLAQANLAGTVGSVRKSNLEDVSLPPEAFSRVCSRLVLHYLQDLTHTFRAVSESLRGDGLFVFSVEHGKCDCIYAIYLCSGCASRYSRSFCDHV